MAIVFIPPQARDLTAGRDRLEVAGSTVGHIVDQLDKQCPGLKGRLCQGTDLKPGWAAVVDGEVARFGMREKVSDKSEVHFLPAIGGG